MSVVRAVVISLCLAAPVCGSSSSVTRKIRFVAVLGALRDVWAFCGDKIHFELTHPSRMTQLQLVKTSPMGTRPSVIGGNSSLRKSGVSLAA